MSGEPGDFKKFKDDFEANHISEDKNETTKEKYRAFRRKPKLQQNYIECKSELAHLFYLNHHLQKDTPHNLLPNMTLEDLPVDFDVDLSAYNFPHYTVNEPTPIYIAKKHCERVDPCFRRTIARSFYRNRVVSTRGRYHAVLQSNRRLRKLQKENIYPPTVFSFAEKLECNPDPYFYGNYDYYYTGGNLCVLSNEDQYVIHVDGSSTIRASTFPSEENTTPTFLEEFATKRLANDGEIFQVAPLANINEETKNIACVRQRNNITIFKILPQAKDIMFITEFSTDSTPLISFAQSVDYPAIFALTTMKESVRVYDMSGEKTSVKYRFNMQTEKGRISWNSIQYWKNQTFLYANERQLCVMDFRTPQEDWLKTCCSFSSQEFPCEFISSLRTSKFENLFYVGSTHKLRCLDTRFLGKNRFFESLSVCEWTHHHDYPPLLLDVHHTNKRDIIATSSPIAGDLRLSELKRSLNADCLSESVYKSYCLPWQPPTLQEAYGSACLAGKALQPEADLKQRIRCCTTGLAFYESKKHSRRKTTMLWSNSNGDIYAQTLRKRSSHDQRISQCSNDLMADYASKVSDLTQPDLNYTDIVDFKSMRKVLLSGVLSGGLSKVEEQPTGALDENADKKKRFKGSWQKSINTLYSYKDALAQDLLSIWDIPREDENDVKFSTIKQKFKNEKDETDILKWLNNDNTLPPTTSVPIKNLEMYASNNNEIEFPILANISQPTLNETDITNISSINEFGLQLGYSTMEDSFVSKRPKLAKPKKKHVKGF